MHQSLNLQCLAPQFVKPTIMLWPSIVYSRRWFCWILQLAKDDEGALWHAVARAQGSVVCFEILLLFVLDRVCDYFGVKIALYFAYLGHYTKALLCPAFLGLLFWLLEGTHQVRFIIFSYSVTLWPFCFRNLRVIMSKHVIVCFVFRPFKNVAYMFVIIDKTFR